MIHLKKLKMLRKQEKYTQMEMAGRLGISESYYCQLENGNRKMSLENALKIASILKKTPNEIFLPADFAERQQDTPLTGTDN